MCERVVVHVGNTGKVLQRRGMEQQISVVIVVREVGIVVVGRLVGITP